MPLPAQTISTSLVWEI